ncbi:mycothiol transferase [Nocardioides sp.]|uniref:mycothiol transferase n=1 Tax=Nocardioides sp. TaxID=35761 RepID=UPI003D13F7A1
MTPAQLLSDAFGRIHDGGVAVLDGLDPDQLATRPGPDANPVGWLVWHLTRVQDDHVADAAGIEQVWTAQGFADRFALPFEVSATGYGQSRLEVGQLRADADQLRSYLTAVHEQTLGYVAGLDAGDLDRVVDHRWDPPVTLGVRLVSVINDDQQHLGQASYVRGLLGL